jgi:hypothetical protein
VPSTAEPKDTKATVSADDEAAIEKIGRKKW